MKKWLIIIIAMLCIPIVYAATTIQISEDNLTWENITDTKWAGVIDETNQTAYIHNLDEGTTYYIRSKNDTSAYNYTSFNTIDAVVGEMTIAVMIFQIFLICLFIAIGVVNKFRYFKWASFIIAFYQTFITLGILWAANSNISYTWLLYFNFILTGIVGFGLLNLSFMFRSIDLMTYETEVDKSQLGMDRFAGDKFEGGKKL